MVVADRLDLMNQMLRYVVSEMNLQDHLALDAITTEKNLRVGVGQIKRMLVQASQIEVVVE
jgi:hypothetical protein